MPKRRIFGNRQPNASSTNGSETDEKNRDLGFGTSISAKNRRLINQDGSFNIRRVGQRIQDIHPFQFLVTISWWEFALCVLVAYLLFNTVFAFLYLMAGVEQLSGGEDLITWLDRFMYAFFFSVQTFTTVGYGTVSPVGLSVNIIAAFEAMTGLLGFAVATGVLMGRFSQPSAKIGFSDQILIAPYTHAEEGAINSLQFRIVNRRINQLIDLEVMVVMRYYNKVNGKEKQDFRQLNLERDKVKLFPLTWTIVHPITQDSPLHGCTSEELAYKHTEFLITLKGYDETFAQHVHARMSYRYDEMIWGAKFVKVFHEMEEGPIELQVDKVSLCEKAELNAY
ncbi:MAG: ion channel [Bacteroidota bacterium]